MGMHLHLQMYIHIYIYTFVNANTIITYYIFIISSYVCILSCEHLQICKDCPFWNPTRRSNHGKPAVICYTCIRNSKSVDAILESIHHRSLTAKAPEKCCLEDDPLLWGRDLKIRGYGKLREGIAFTNIVGHTWLPAKVWYRGERNPANQLIWQISHNLQRFMHVRWFTGFLNHQQYDVTQLI